jgi:hypothetical protein
VLSANPDFAFFAVKNARFLEAKLFSPFRVLILKSTKNQKIEIPNGNHKTGGLMNRRLIALLTVISFALAGCGSSTPTVVTQILSDPFYDGDIAENPDTVLTPRRAIPRASLQG